MHRVKIACFLAFFPWLVRGDEVGKDPQALQILEVRYPSVDCLATIPNKKFVSFDIILITGLYLFMSHPRQSNVGISRISEEEGRSAGIRRLPCRSNYFFIGAVITLVFPFAMCIQLLSISTL